MCSQDHCDCDCECCRSGACCRGGNGFERRFQTKAEQISELESYLSQLKLEVQAVEERLSDLKK
jgi:hypothetical protein